MLLLRPILLGSLLLGATGVSAKEENHLTRAFTNCFTSSGTVSPRGHVPTIHVSETLIIPVKTKSTEVIRTTKTPPAITSTSTAVTTSTSVSTLSQVTDTFSTTTTLYTTTTFTESDTSTTTSTETATTTVSTIFTIPASAGFTPIASAIATAGGTPSKRRRNKSEQHCPPHNALLPLRGNKCSNSQPPIHQYAEEVICNTFYEVFSTSTQVATRTKTITACPSTSVATSTSTITTISTTLPTDASTTLSFSTTSTVSTTTTTTTTITETTTTTSTVALPTATTYAACQADNIVSHYAPDKPFLGGSDANGYHYNTADDAYDCCVQCIQAGSTCGAYYYWGASDLCVYFSTGTSGLCDATTVVGTAYYYETDSVNVVVGNSNCGQYDFVYSDL